MNLTAEQQRFLQDALCAANVMAACAVWADVEHGYARSAALNAKWAVQIARAMNISFGNEFCMTEDGGSN